MFIAGTFNSYPDRNVNNINSSRDRLELRNYFQPELYYENFCAKVHNVKSFALVIINVEEEALLLITKVLLSPRLKS